MTEDDLEKLSRLAAEQRNGRFMCENCGWFGGVNSKNDTGECRRYPPSVLSSVPLNPLWLWPIVHAESVCGEFIHRKTEKRFLPDPVEPLRARIAGIEQDVERLKRGFTLVEALVVLAILATLAGLLWPAISAVRHAAKPPAATVIPDTWELYTSRHDGHLWVLNGSSYFSHHPDCQCRTRQPEANTLTEMETWALNRIIASEEKQWGDSNTAQAFREILKKYGSETPFSTELEFQEHRKKCEQCSGGPELSLCEEGFRLLQQDMRRSR